MISKVLLSYCDTCHDGDKRQFKIWNNIWGALNKHILHTNNFVDNWAWWAVSNACFCSLDFQQILMKCKWGGRHRCCWCWCWCYALCAVTLKITISFITRLNWCRQGAAGRRTALPLSGGLFMMYLLLNNCTSNVLIRSPRPVHSRIGSAAWMETQRLGKEKLLSSSVKI